ncbi:hypothetical protein ACKKBF_B35860 [Auxenochlorella protothecoides x Auxenochlorella symbiontica]
MEWQWAAGVLLCLTGFDREQRARIREVVETAGGRYSGSLSRRCTHLLVAGQAGRCPSPKLDAALALHSRWGLCIADESWWEACVASKRLLPPSSLDAKENVWRPDWGQNLTAPCQPELSTGTARSHRQACPPEPPCMAAPPLPDSPLATYASVQPAAPPARTSSMSHSCLLAALRERQAEASLQCPQLKKPRPPAQETATLPRGDSPPDAMDGLRLPAGLPAPAVLPVELGQAQERTSSNLPHQNCLARDSVKQPPAALFGGMRVVLDPALSRDVSQRCKRELEGGGATLCGAHEASHVVCLLAKASSWLRAGRGVLSPDWVHQSWKAGSKQRQLSVSADLARQHDILGGATVVAEPQVCHASADRMGEERRRAFVEALESRAGAAPQHFQFSTLPTRLLMGVSWSLLEDPATCWEVRQELEEAGEGSSAPADLRDWVEDSQDEETGPPSPHQPDPTQEQGDAQVLLRCPSLTLVFPRDNTGTLAHTCQTHDLPEGGTSALHLLRLVHAFYHATMDREEGMALMQQGGLAGAAGQALRRAFLDDVPITRAHLLGPRLRFEGLSRATRDPAAAVYEVWLGC